MRWISSILNSGPNFHTYLPASHTYAISFIDSYDMTFVWLNQSSFIDWYGTHSFVQKVKEQVKKENHLQNVETSQIDRKAGFGGKA